GDDGREPLLPDDAVLLLLRVRGTRARAPARLRAAFAMRAGAHGHPRKWLASGLLVISCLVAALSVGAVHYVHALSQLGDTASSNSSLSFEDREIAGGNSIVVDQRAAYEARALIPATDAYRVAVGPNLREKTELTEA